MLLIVLQIGNNKLMYVSIVTAMAVFHLGTIEEYYLGILELPMINAVDDGSIFLIAIWIVAGSMGNVKFAHNVCNGRWLHINGIDQLTVG